MVTFRQTGFSKGELRKGVFGREDLEILRKGLATARNAQLEGTGAVRNRCGTTFVCKCRFTGQTVGLIPFVFNLEDGNTYQLIFGDEYIWVVKSGALLYEASKNVSAISRSAQALVTTSAAHGYSEGDVIRILAAGGMKQVNGRQFKVADPGVLSFKLKDMDGSTYVSSVDFDVYTSGGTVQRVYTIESPYAEEDLSNISYAQSGDVIELACRGYAPRNLSRTADTSWTLSVNVFNNVYAPRDGEGTPDAAGSNVYKYIITAIYGRTGDDQAREGKESLAGTAVAVAITNITTAEPPVVTTLAAHGFAEGDPVFVDDVTGTDEVNQRVFMVANPTATTFELQGIDATGYTAYVSGGKVARTFIEVIDARAPSRNNPITLTWSATTTGLGSAATEVTTTTYNIYKEVNGIYNFIATTNQLEYEDIGVTSTSVDTPYEFRDLFIEEDDWPWRVTLYQGRLGYAGSENNPDTGWLSVVGDYHNFAAHNPPRDSDAVTIPLGSNQVNEVRALLGVRRLIILTAGAEWVVNGDSNGVVTPKAINAVSDDESGAAAIRPVVSGSRVLYVQDGTFHIRDLGFEFEADGYRGNDLSILSAHLFDGYQVVGMAFQKGPTPTLWVIRSDGVLLSCTYIREQSFVAWTWCDTDGLFENVCIVPESDSESVYFVVNRDGTRCLERLNDRLIDADTDGGALEDKAFVDCGTSYNGWSEDGDPTMTLSGVDFDAGELLTLTANASYFAEDDEGDSIFLVHRRDEDDPDDEEVMVKCRIITYTNSTTVSVRPDLDVPSSLQAVAVAAGDWAHAIATLPNCWQNEGLAVSVFADEYVISSPSNPDYATITVEDGETVLPEPRAVIHSGRPYYTDFKTLPIDTLQGETLLDKKILITNVTVFPEDSRGGFVGSEPPSDDLSDPLEALDTLFVRGDEDLSEPPSLQNEPVTVPIPSEWKSGGSVFLRQVDPLPITVLGLACGGMIPFRGGVS